jgi:hypothetical protein
MGRTLSHALHMPLTRDAPAFGHFDLGRFETDPTLFHPEPVPSSRFDGHPEQPRARPVRKFQQSNTGATARNRPHSARGVPSKKDEQWDSSPKTSKP